MGAATDPILGGRWTPNLRSLEALRGVLAVYVMLGHARWLLWDGHFRWIQEPHPGWANALAYSSAVFRYGHEAVICFFVLSGFFIHFRWADASGRGAHTPFSLRDYAKRRAHRLVPPYVVALAATLLIDAIGWTFFPVLYSAATGDALLDQNFARSGYAPQNVVPALVLLPGSLGADYGTNGPLWSLGYEFVYYALYPAWLWARNRTGRWAYAIGVVFSLAMYWLIASPFFSQVFLLYPLWLTGALLAEHMLGAGTRVSRDAMAALALAGFAGLHFVRAPFLLLPYVLLGIGVVAFAAALPQGLANLRMHRALEWLGLRSYTIYVCHFPFLALVSAVIFETQGRRPSSGWVAVAAAAAALAWCSALWWIGERRYLHAPLRIERAPR